MALSCFKCTKDRGAAGTNVSLNWQGPLVQLVTATMHRVGANGLERLAVPGSWLRFCTPSKLDDAIEAAAYIAEALLRARS